MLLVVYLGLHSRILRVHLVSSYLAMWPTQHHFMFVTSSTIYYAYFSYSVLFSSSKTAPICWLIQVVDVVGCDKLRKDSEASSSYGFTNMFSIIWRTYLFWAFLFLAVLAHFRFTCAFAFFLYLPMINFGLKIENADKDNILFE